MKFIADENFNGDIVRGLQSRKPDLDLVRVQDVGLSGVDDPTILEWPAQERRLALTHDVSTMTAYAIDRVRMGKSMPGVVEVGGKVAVGEAIEYLVLLAECSLEGEWQGRVVFMPKLF